MEFLFRKKDYYNYTEDSLLNSQNIWYWKWKNEDVDNLFSKCSKCNAILVYDENRGNDIVYYYCPKCNSQEMAIKGGTYNYSQRLLRREIKRKIQLRAIKKVS